MLSEVTSALSTIITWVGTVVIALTSTNGALAPLLPLLCVGIGVSAFMLGIKMIRSTAWGA